jgi:NADPH:quinone reductase-like Zn-dependent oxidoreductase
LSTSNWLNPSPGDASFWSRSARCRSIPSTRKCGRRCNPLIAEQGKLLDEVARLIDSGTLRTTLGASFGAINAKNLERAHTLIESGRAKGKMVLEGFGD